VRLEDGVTVCTQLPLLMDFLSALFLTVKELVHMLMNLK